MSRKSRHAHCGGWFSCLLILTTLFVLYHIHPTLLTTKWDELGIEAVDERHIRRQSFISANTQNFADIEVLRTREITKKCEHSFQRQEITEYRTLNISEMPMNLVPFLNRCSINKTIFPSNHAEWLEMFINSKFGYIHNYKVAGTTIQESLHEMGKTGKLSGRFVFNQSGDILRWNRRFLKQSQYFQHREEWYSLMTDIFLFSLIRDPIDRFLSAFHEVNLRDIHLFKIYGIAYLHGMDKLRSLLSAFWNAQKRLFRDGAIGIKVKQIWSAEAHFHPQTLFLLNADLNYFPLDYVGDLKYFEEITRPILWEFVPYLQKQPKFIDYAMKRYRTRGIGHREKSEFDIERDALNDSDIRMICDLYWIDYICFPMQVPSQCNITDLLLAHYGKHITFNDCYVSSD